MSATEQHDNPGTGKIYDPIADTLLGLRGRAGGHPPAVGPSAVQIDAAAPPQAAADLSAAVGDRDHWPATGAGAGHAGDRQRPDGADGERADRRADHGQRSHLRHRGQAAARDARGDLAGERRRPLCPPVGPVGRAARPQLQRRRPLSDRLRGPVPVHNDQAGPVPVAQPPQRVAARAHPFLAARPRFHPAAGDPDVLSRRPVLPIRPDLQLRGRRALPRADDRELLDLRHGPQLGGRAYHFDIFLRGPGATPFEEAHS